MSNQSESDYPLIQKSNGRYVRTAAECESEWKSDGCWNPKAMISESDTDQCQNCKKRMSESILKKPFISMLSGDNASKKLLSRMYKKQKNDLQTFCQVKLKNAATGT